MSNAIEQQAATHISMPNARYMWLLNRLDKLLRLEMEGVDTWEGYKQAMRGYKEKKQ